MLVGTRTLGAPVQLIDFGNYIGASRNGNLPVSGEIDEIGIWSVEIRPSESR